MYLVLIIIFFVLAVYSFKFSGTLFFIKQHLHLYIHPPPKNMDFSRNDVL